MKTLAMSLTLVSSIANAQAGSNLQCANGQEIQFDRPLTQIFGRPVKAKLRNFPLALKDPVKVGPVAGNGEQLIRVETAYCGYSFLVSHAGKKPVVLRAGVDCEGASEDLSCQIH